MAHWQLGEREQARDWYAKALAWVQEHKPPVQQVRGIWIEAATLLGEEPPTAKPENRNQTPANDSGTNEQ